MKTNKTGFIENFISNSQKARARRTRLTALLCVLSMIVSSCVTWALMIPGLTLSGDPLLPDGTPAYSWATDDITWDRWTDRFGANKQDTEYAGGVWTDKSVGTTLTTNYGTNGNRLTFTADSGNTLVGLSAIGSTLQVSGKLATPTDTVIILDLSSSMYDGGASAIENMINAVNTSINTLFDMNEYNRVGVVAYYGTGRVNVDNASTEEQVIKFLPLDRYVEKTLYLTLNDAKTTITSNATSKTSNTTHKESHNFASFKPAGTYMQLGLLQALKEFQSKKNSTTVDITIGDVTEKVQRQPVFIFMTDGVPTAVNSDYTGTEFFGNGDYKAQWGWNSNPWRSKEESDFVTQLTASYVKEEVDIIYQKSPLFYTMGYFLGNIKTATNATTGKRYFSEDVVNPMGQSASAEIKNWWNTLIDKSQVVITVDHNKNTWNFNMTTKNYTIEKKQLSNKEPFPSSIDQLDYVDAYFEGGDNVDIQTLFTSIISDLRLRIAQSPTYTTSDNTHSGEVSFVDRIGEYMEIKGIEGILLGDKLYTGAELAAFFTENGTTINGESFGSFDNPSTIGWRFHLDVKNQLGIGGAGSDFSDEELLPDATNNPNGLSLAHWVTTYIIRKAFENGTLRAETQSTPFSNYVEWVADANLKCLGPYPSSNNKYDESAKYIIRSYFFKGKTSSTEGGTLGESDMMYARVWIMTEIELDKSVASEVRTVTIPGKAGTPIITASGEPATVTQTVYPIKSTKRQTLGFSVPSQLLPTEVYSIEVDEDGNPLKVENLISDDFAPVRLVYEVGLREDITPDNLSEKVSKDYLDKNTSDGRVNFYSNAWERYADSGGRFTGPEKTNTYSYFYPALNNDRFYYTSDTLLLSEADINKPYAGQQPIYSTAKHYYTAHRYYDFSQQTTDSDGKTTGVTVKYYYLPVSNEAINNVKLVDGKWYIAAGTPHALPSANVNQYASWKTGTDSSNDHSGTGNDYIAGIEDNWSLATHNHSATLPVINIPYVGPDMTSSQGLFIMAATLGNNGRLSIAPTGPHKLIKTLKYADGTAYTLAQDKTFQFLIHEGEALGSYADASKVYGALNSASKKMSVIEVTVRAGSSQSDPVPLMGLTDFKYSQADQWDAIEGTSWSCVFNEQYTVVEIDTGNDFKFSSLGGSTTNAYTFRYGIGNTLTADGYYAIECVNTVDYWKLKLTKYDSEAGSNPLPGAEFALYTPLESERIAEYSGDAQLTYSDGTTTYYLRDVKTTGNDGVIEFDSLTQETYIAVETKAPPGYYLNSAPIVLSRSSITAGNVLEQNVTNEPGKAALPTTGGVGTEIFTVLGTAIMLTSAVLLVKYSLTPARKRKQKRT